MPEFEFKGKIESILVPTIMLNLAGLKKTGILSLESVCTTSIYFYKGSIVFAESNDEETFLGRMLLRRGKIDEKVYRQILQEAEKKEGKTGEFLISCGIITPHELSSFLEDQVKERVIKALTYPKGDYTFRDTEEFVDCVFFCDLKLSELMLSSLSDSIDVDKIDLDNVILVPKPQLIESVSGLDLRPRQLRIVQRLTKSINALEVLKTEGVSKKDFVTLLLYLWFSDLIDIENISPFDLCLSSFETVWKSRSYGSFHEKKEEPPIIELKDEITEKKMAEEPTSKALFYERVESDMDEENEREPEEIAEERLEPIELDLELDKVGKNASQNSYEDSGFFQQDDEDESDTREIMQFYKFVIEEDDSFKILGVDRDCTDDEVKEAYFDLVKRFHPDSNPHFPEDIRIKAQEIFTKVTQAYNKIDTEEKRKTYESAKEVEKLTEEIERIRESELFFQEGELLLKQRLYPEAVKRFEKAIEINPEEPAYVGALIWARFLASDNRDAVASDAIKELERVKSLNPNIAENLYYLGSLYKFMGDLEKAEENFSKVVKLDPYHLQAKRELRLIRNRKNEKKVKKRKRDKFGIGFFSSFFKK